MTIGKELQQARHKKGIDLKDAEDATKIRVKFLEALETDRFENVPEPVYVKGFLRTYAAFLGINGAKLVDKYKALLPDEEPKKQSPDSSQEPITARGCVVEPEKKKSSALPWLTTLIAIFLLFILALGILGQINPKGFTPEPNQNSTVERKTVPSKPKIQGIYITVMASQRTYVEIKKDGRLAFIGNLNPKKKVDIHGEESVEVLCDNGNLLRVYKNHEFIGILSTKPGFTRQAFTK